MIFGHKVVIGVDFNEKCKEQLESLQELSFLRNSEVHLVHVFQTTSMVYGLMAEYSLVYPVERDRKEIEKSIEAKLLSLSESVFGPQVKIVTKCLFDENPKEEFCLYAKEIKADTIIVFSRIKHGIFESSFAQYCNRHSHCNLIILKQ